MDIRLAIPADGTALSKIYGPIVEKTTISFEEIAPDHAEMSARIQAVLRTHPWIVCEINREVVGYAYATQHRTRAAYQWSCEVSAYVAEAHRGKGIARALYLKLFEVLSAQGFHRAYAGITYPNNPSVGFHDAMGFSLIGVYEKVGFKHGHWRDVGWWCRELQPQINPPTALLRLQEIHIDW